MDYVINKELVKARGIDEDTAIDIQLHQFERTQIEKRMKDLDPTKDQDKLQELFADWKKNEFKLQELWGFEQSTAHHRDWELPHCICPKMDNEDMYPTDQRWITAGCIYHSL